VTAKGVFRDIRLVINEKGNNKIPRQRFALPPLLRKRGLRHKYPVRKVAATLFKKRELTTNDNVDQPIKTFEDDDDTTLSVTLQTKFVRVCRLLTA
jgi:hypothetical protein